MTEYKFYEFASNITIKLPLHKHTVNSLTKKPLFSSPFSFTIKLVTHIIGRFYARDVKVVETFKSTGVKTGLKKIDDNIEKNTLLKKKKKLNTVSSQSFLNERGINTTQFTASRFDKSEFTQQDGRKKRTANVCVWQT